MMSSYSVERSKRKMAKAKEKGVVRSSEDPPMVLVGIFVCSRCKDIFSVQWSSGHAYKKVFRCQCGCWFIVKPPLGLEEAVGSTP
jgi:DNA replicative helicase MCM subunit Mcm2 (Cdc46/Mcm family)